jgi:copper(I)-binding protein
MVALGLLTAWVVTGQAGSPARVHVANAWVMAPTAPQTAAYFTLDNSGDVPDDLLRVRTPIASMAMLGRQVNHAGVGRMAMGGALAVPAHGIVQMTPFTINVMIQPSQPLPVGRRVPFTLVFRHSGTIDVTAVVEPPGGPTMPSGPR